MLKLEEIKNNMHIAGLVADSNVTVIQVKRLLEDSVKVVYEKPDGVFGSQVIYRDAEPNLSLAQSGIPWSFDAPGKEFSLALEATRIKLGYAFDPMMAIHTSTVEPLPHQIAAVYESMLPKQPLRFILADDPGAGKTIMAGLLIQELLMRADAQRVLIVCPGALTEQWQDELSNKFTLDFRIFSRELQEQCASGNYFQEQDLMIARVDQLARAEDLQDKLKLTRWDLVVVDEAHKMSAQRYGSEVKKTQRYELGELLGSITRHLLLMTATPHNGKNDDFRLFLSLLDKDRFYRSGKCLSDDGALPDVSDCMRRMVKEDLLKFDGTHLFPQREAYTLNYKLTREENALYQHVTQYVVEEMNRAESRDGQRRGQVGFALIMLQRRLASSPEAIYQSLRRRRERLQKELTDLKAGRSPTTSTYSAADLEDLEDNLTGAEYEDTVNQILGHSTAAATVEELSKEIHSLEALESEAAQIRNSGHDTKWDQLRQVLHDDPRMRNAAGNRRKLIIFTEHKDTLDYLQNRIAGFLGNSKAVAVIHGATKREDRKTIQEEFCNNPDVLVLVATDAAGEGVNLQCANLMVNYDLPWNPNRIEQRFGRIHRIGQTETCVLWNMVASETREGAVFEALFRKLEEERKTLGGQVFDILGEAFNGDKSLKDLLLDAIRRIDSPEARDYMTQQVESKLDTNALKAILQRNALAKETMSPERLYAVKEEMDKAEARKLQPCFVGSFFQRAYTAFKGEIRAREEGRYELPNVPPMLLETGRALSNGRRAISRKYDRICFDKKSIRPRSSMAEAAFLHPGHLLMQALLKETLDQYGRYLKPGTVMVDPGDLGVTPSLLFLIDHSVCEESGELISRRLQFVRMTPDGNFSDAGWAPHLDLAPASKQAQDLAQGIRREEWLQGDLESKALEYAATNMGREHFSEAAGRRKAQVEKIRKAVQERLVPEINYWYTRAEELRKEVAAGKQPRVQPRNATQNGDELSARLEQRKRELDAMGNVVNRPPSVLGGILVIPQGLLNKTSGVGVFCGDPAARKRIESIAMNAVVETERSFGHTVKDVSAAKCGWDVTAIPQPGANGAIPDARHIEVKGRAKGADTITVTRNEICCAINQADKFILAIVTVNPDDTYDGPYYILKPFDQLPAPEDVSSNKDIDMLLKRAVKPEQTLSHPIHV